MSNEEGSSSHAVEIQEENVPVDPATQYLNNRMQRINDDIFSPIYMAPDILREVNSISFTPRVVSIGPLHYGRRNLKSVERQKPSDQKKLLEKVGSLQEILDSCVRMVRGKMQEIKRCYFGMKKYTDDELRQMTQMKKYSDYELLQMTLMKKYTADEVVQMKLMKKYSDDELLQMTLMKKYTDDELVQMNQMKKYSDDEILQMKQMKKYSDDELVQIMVMDGCFILQFIDNLSDNLLLENRSRNLLLENRWRNLSLENRLRSRNIALDLVLLENQIAFFVLQDIYNLTLGRRRPGCTLTTMLSALLELVNPFSESLMVENVGIDQPDYETPNHILGLLDKFYKPNFTLPEIREIPTAHSAVELDKVGVKITPNENLPWPMAMEFDEPTLKMPVVRIDNFFEVVLRNLIAYEQYSPVNNYVTSYAMAMHMLVATPADIAMLGKSGVINVSHLGSSEKASDMISNICKNVNLQDFYYMKAWTDIAGHYDSYWPRNFGEFKRMYIDTPWKAIALLAAVIVFLITVAQFFRQIVKSFL